jgi:hypothetical protein
VDTQQVVSNLVGALIFAIPLTARAYYKRLHADASVKNTVVKSNAVLETKVTERDAKILELTKSISMLEQQNESNNELISLMSEQKTKDDKIISVLRKEIEELDRIVKTGETHSTSVRRK